jgi:DnaJ-class molecular chaperone
LLEFLGWLPPRPDEPESTSCATCSGGGVLHFRSGNQEPCSDCGGSGLRVDQRLAGTPVVEIVAQIVAQAA